MDGWVDGLLDGLVGMGGWREQKESARGAKRHAKKRMRYRCARLCQQKAKEEWLRKAVVSGHQKEEEDNQKHRKGKQTRGTTANNPDHFSYGCIQVPVTVAVYSVSGLARSDSGTSGLSISLLD